MRENLSEPWLVTFVTLLTTLIVAKVIQSTLKKSEKRTQRLPPGRRGWPLIGDSINWYNAVASSHPPQFVEEMVQRYGKIFSCSLFGKWAVVSADPSFNRFVMQNEGKLFRSSYPKSFRDLVGKNGVITVQGEQQRKLHGIASNMMRLEKLKLHFLNDIQKVLLQTLSNFKNNQVILLQDVCRKVAINLMVNQLLGVSSESQVNEMAQLFSDFVDGCLSFPINLPGFAYHTAMKAREKIISKINKTIDLHRQQGPAVVGNGVLGRLLEEESLPDGAVADFIINLLFAGNETTTKTMLFAVYFLTHCPEALKEILDEQESVRSNSGEEMLTWQDYKAMPFTQCVIDETLRLGGIAIWLMREAKEEILWYPRDALWFHFFRQFIWMRMCTKKLQASIHGDGWTPKTRKRGTGEVVHSMHPLEEVLDSVQEQSWLAFRLLYLSITLLLHIDGHKRRKIRCPSSPLLG
ncbi:abietadienol/abietadienal oxidase isoform X3 [Prosopis cineraria]|uniref:abietadienol/abietadienal oxidase isoform X3 n=1 Tax=Prosopis cineraria TaxID=364024 RepID=UPI00240F3463|nr:abietadienol/abietadienal oxidase isoform X3 [Prosopis cineraria]